MMRDEISVGLPKQLLATIKEHRSRLAALERALSRPGSRIALAPTRVPVDTGTTISSSSFQEIGTTNTQLSVELPRPNMTLVIAFMADVVISTPTTTTRAATALWNGTAYYSNWVYHQVNANGGATRMMGTQVVVPTVTAAGTFYVNLRGRRDTGDGTCLWNATHSGIALINAYG